MLDLLLWQFQPFFKPNTLNSLVVDLDTFISQHMCHHAIPNPAKAARFIDDFRSNLILIRQFRQLHTDRQFDLPLTPGKPVFLSQHALP